MENKSAIPTKKQVNPGCFIVVVLINCFVILPLLAMITVPLLAISSLFLLGIFLPIFVLGVSLAGIIIINATKYRTVGGILLFLPILVILIVVIYQTIAGGIH